MRRRWRRVVRSFVLSSDTRKGKERRKEKKIEKSRNRNSQDGVGHAPPGSFFFLFSSHLRREEREFPVAEMCWFSSSLFGAIFGSPENPIDNTKLCCQQRVHLVSSRVSFRHERRRVYSKLG